MIVHFKIHCLDWKVVITWYLSFCKEIVLCGYIWSYIYISLKSSWGSLHGIGFFYFQRMFPPKVFGPCCIVTFYDVMTYLSFSVCLCMVGWRGRSGNKMQHSNEVNLKDLESQPTSWWHLLLFSFSLSSKPSHSVRVVKTSSFTSTLLFSVP